MLKPEDVEPYQRTLSMPFVDFIHKFLEPTSVDYHGSFDPRPISDKLLDLIKHHPLFPYYCVVRPAKSTTGFTQHILWLRRCWLDSQEYKDELRAKSAQRIVDFTEADARRDRLKTQLWNEFGPASGRKSPFGIQDIEKMVRTFLDNPELSKSALTHFGYFEPLPPDVQEKLEAIKRSRAVQT